MFTNSQTQKLVSWLYTLQHKRTPGMCFAWTTLKEYQIDVHRYNIIDLPGITST